MSRHPTSRPPLATILVTLAALGPTPREAPAAILPSQVLVVYNSASSEGTALKDAYLAAHPSIPTANVLDLNNAALLVADLSYAQFIALVRNPIRTYLSQPGPPAPRDVVAIVLIRPFPHRIDDTDVPGTGDSPGTSTSETLAGDMTCASVDAELVLLWQNLESGEAGGTMDSVSDNFIDNPYHQSTAPIEAFSRQNITTQKMFINTLDVAWLPGGIGPTQLTPGDMYLVCRIDGNSLDEARASIGRAEDLYVNRALTRILFDEWDAVLSGGQDIDDDGLFSDTAADPFWGGADFEEATALLTGAGWDVRHDHTFNFVSGPEEPRRLVAYSSYGENHSFNGFGEDPVGFGTYIDEFRFVRGAVFNTFESYNGRALNGLSTLFTQEQVADFIAAGGTFAVGNVYEPFTFSVADNEHMLRNLLVSGRTWGEAAYTALPALSWQQIVLGDPLAAAAIINDAASPMGDLDGNGTVNALDIRWFVRILLEGLAAYRAAFPALDPIARADFNDNGEADPGDTPGFVAALTGP